MKKYFRFLKETLKHTWLIIILPVLTGLMWAIFEITDTSFDITKVADWNLWINSFMLTYLVYMIFDGIANHYSFFQKHSYLSAGISFIISTVLGGALSYTLKETLKWQDWLAAIGAFIFGYVIIQLCFYIGLLKGREKQISKIEEEYKQQIELMESLTIEEIDSSIKAFKKAMKLDNDVFSAAAIFKGKESLKIMIEELEKIKSGKIKNRDSKQNSN